MPSVKATRTIDAPVSRVFDLIATPERYARAVPAIKKVEILSKIDSGLGCRFRETREMKGREAATELEITEFTPNEMIRFVSEAGGARWDSVFTTTARNGGTRLDLVMEARPTKLLARLMLPLMMGPVGQAIESDMDAVKAYCER